MLLMMETAGRRGNVTPNVSQPENIQVCVCVCDGGIGGVSGGSQQVEG